jgi:hypothetical protein
VAFRRFGLLLYQIEATLQQAYRLPMGTAPQRLLGGEPEVPDGAPVIAAGTEVAREFIRIRIGQGAVCCFEFLADEAMEA